MNEGKALQGVRNKLSYFENKDAKPSWSMHEFVLDESIKPLHKKLEKLTLCKISIMKTKKGKNDSDSDPETTEGSRKRRQQQVEVIDFGDVEHPVVPTNPAATLAVPQSQYMHKRRLEIGSGRPSEPLPKRSQRHHR
ncbi:hypothetical protein Tsubulata_030677 [Turnera subulata]|uniref:NAC domain-containing protein n=1 Tax=Turnera subulata TaxID=218843 RepID=A0A9Q0J265_9ROSI|nr:hypothetical protein Tsubulata_030677 [Turnera subulata]